MSTIAQTSDSSVARGKTLKVIGNIARYTILIILAFSFIVPFYWMASSAIARVTKRLLTSWRSVM